MAHSHRRGKDKSRMISSKIAEGVTLHFSADKIIGNGSFGVVFEAKIAETGEVVAIKKVLQDKRFKNRELHIMKQLDHCNVCKLKHCFYTSGSKSDELYLNLVLEFVPETVFNITRHYLKAKQLPPLICVKLYMYQLCRSLGYIHSLGVCHRDIKPQNLLVDPSNHVLKLCDFGSAKVLVKGEPNVAYICSRYYRAPELIFGATDYTTAIDIWSAGCVCAELLLGTPLFPGESGVDQLVEIIKVLGTPKREDIRAMNCSYAEFQFPQIKSHPWNKVLRRAPADAIDFVSRLLVYTPSQRLTPLEACAHPLFDELRHPRARLPNGKPLPPLFNFTQEEMKQQPELFKTLIPEHARNNDNWPPPGLTVSPSPKLPTPKSAVVLPRAGGARPPASGASRSYSSGFTAGTGAGGAGAGGGDSGKTMLPSVGGSSHTNSGGRTFLPSVPPPSSRHTTTARTSGTVTERVPTIRHSSRQASSRSFYRDRESRTERESARGERASGGERYGSHGYSARRDASNSRSRF